MHRGVGIDLTASRVRAAAVGGGMVRTLVLDDPGEDLVLAVAGDRRTPEAGHAGEHRLPNPVQHLGSTSLQGLRDLGENASDVAAPVVEPRAGSVPPRMAAIRASHRRLRTHR